MEPLEWAAILGAAAWLPQLGQWIYRAATKAKVVFIPVRELELGFSVYGPILNLRAAIGAERRDATITLITVRLRHERGRVVTLRWTSFTETFSRMRSGESTTEVEREQVATALRISTAFLTDKFIRFQDPEFQLAAVKLHQLAAAEKQRLDKSGAPMQAILATKEYEDLIAHYRHAFSWESGQYTMAVDISLLGESAVALAETEFTLTPPAVDSLRKNIDLIDAHFRSVIHNGEVAQQMAWNWANPIIDTARLLKKAYLPTHRRG